MCMDIDAGDESLCIYVVGSKCVHACLNLCARTCLCVRATGLVAFCLLTP